MEIETEIAELEAQIIALIKRHQEIGNENELLRQKLSKTLQENAVNSEKNQKAISRIKQIVSQLKNEVREPKSHESD